MMLTNFEIGRRKRNDVCSCCGWGLVQFDDPYNRCVNDRCPRPSKKRATPVNHPKQPRGMVSVKHRTTAQ